MNRRVPLVLGAGLVGALALPGWRVGIGWPIAALAALTAVLLARGGGRANTERTSTADRAWRLAAGLAALVLVSMAAIRDAGWLVAICLVSSALLGSYALVGGRSWRAIGRGMVALVPAALPDLVGSPDQPQANSNGPTNSEGRTGSTGRAQQLTLATLTGVGLVVLFGALLRGERTYADAISGLAGEISPAQVWRTILGFVALVALTAGAIRLANNKTASTTDATGEPPQTGAGRRLGLLEWAIPVAMLDLLFATFVGVQVRVLFAGDTYVLERTGPTYAGFARGAIWQLTLVSVLTLGILALLARFAERSSRSERLLLRVLGGLLCGQTLVIVASALRRLALYASAYGLTVPRLLVFAGVVWLGLVFVLVIVAGVRLSATWLPRTTVAAAVAVLIGLCALNPEAFMARTMLQWRGTYPVDYAYLYTLSADAAAELDRIPGSLRACAIDGLSRRLEKPDAWYVWNLSREQARDILARSPSVCDWQRDWYRPG